MDKKTALPGEDGFNTFYPGSIVLVSAVDAEGKADICTVGAWALVNGVPRMYGIAMCAREARSYFFKRYTTTCIEQTGEFVINIPHDGLREACDVCGTVSLTNGPSTARITCHPLGYASWNWATVARASLAREVPSAISMISW